MLEVTTPSEQLERSPIGPDWNVCNLKWCPWSQSSNLENFPAINVASILFMYHFIRYIYHTFLHAFFVVIIDVFGVNNSINSFPPRQTRLFQPFISEIKSTVVSRAEWSAEVKRRLSILSEETEQTNLFFQKFMF